MVVLEPVTSGRALETSMRHQVLGPGRSSALVGSAGTKRMALAPSMALAF